MFWLTLFCFLQLVLAWHNASIRVYALEFGLYILFFSFFSAQPILVISLFWIVYFILFTLFVITPIRRRLLSRSIFIAFQKAMPSISRTEKEALLAGTIGFEAEIFSGNPDWRVLQAMPIATLSDEEHAFLQGPVEAICHAIDDWHFTHNLTDIPETLWTELKTQGFFGLIIPKEYGGKGFSATAVARILSKVYSRSIGVASTIAVPNSLGPAELLIEYGTDAQKKYYLPRLASGEEIPCFALTAPSAGSDAASIPDRGIVCYQLFEGINRLGIRLSWDKRYITLAPVATVLGLAFRLFDPDCILSDVNDLGITCALIPTNLPGIQIGRRHFPLNTCFMNGPTRAKDVFIPMDWVIGGQECVGLGWRMLMACLSAGRAVSLPSSAVGASLIAAMATGAYARVRTQFGNPIGHFEGIQEPLARIAARTYMVNALLNLTVTAIDLGEKPVVASAITKYHATELSRLIINDAMDVHGGKGICLGPTNYLGRFYQGIPVGITVEGANILTRSLIIFGQGAIRCHPYLLKEMQAVENQDLTTFDAALFAHLGQTVSNGIRSFVYGCFNPFLARSPWQALSRFSAQFAFIAEMAILNFGSTLKRREMMSGRLGDVLSYIYIASAVLKRHQDEGAWQEDHPLVERALQELFCRIQDALVAAIHHFPSRLLRGLLWMVCFPFGKKYYGANDQLDRNVAELLIRDCPTRARLIAGMPTHNKEHDPLYYLQDAFEKIVRVQDLEQRLHRAEKDKKIPVFLTMVETIQAALSEGIITRTEYQALFEANAARIKIIGVDDFSDDELRRS